MGKSAWHQQMEWLQEDRVLIHILFLQKACCQFHNEAKVPVMSPILLHPNAGPGASKSALGTSLWLLAF